MSRDLLFAVRGHAADAEAEPVVATVLDGYLTLDLDDGDRLVINLDELLALAVADDAGSETQDPPSALAPAPSQQEASP